MPETGLTRSPKLQKGALVQLIETLGVPLPSIVGFQFNPMKVSRSFRIWTPPHAGEAGPPPAPDVQPFDPEETISMEIELDATDGLEDDKPTAKEFGIADRLAALEKMLFAGDSPLQQVQQAAAAVAALAGGGQPAVRRTVPIVLLVWGVGRMVPVRITSFSVEETLFLPSLRPLQATVNVAMQVLVPEVFAGLAGPSAAVARGAYELYRKQQDALAILNVANAPEAIRALLPF
jgi:hypothetical protein